MVITDYHDMSSIAIWHHCPRTIDYCAVTSGDVEWVYREERENW